MSRKRTSEEAGLPQTARTGKIRIGSKYKRAVVGDASASAVGFTNIDVTSGSMNKVGGVAAKTLSPFTIGPVVSPDGTIISQTFEAWWQGSKIWLKKGHADPCTDANGKPSWKPSAKWRKLRAKEWAMKKGRRRPFGLTKEDGPADMAWLAGRMWSYIPSRAFYFRVYQKLINELPIMDELEKLVRSGVNVMILDGDGPPKDREPNGVELTIANWDAYMQNANHPFGHGWVVARVLAQRCGCI